MKLFAPMVLSVVLGTLSHASSGNHDLPNFVQVNQNLYRGGRPTEAGIKELKDKGVKTVIDLQGGDLHSIFLPYVYFSEPGERKSKIKQEQEIVESYKLNFRSYPINSMKKMTDEESSMIFNQVLVDMENPDLQPVYVHCQHGQDRTGLVVALERMRIVDEKLGRVLSAQEAFDEWQSMGHGKFLNQVFTRKLDKYFLKLYPNVVAR